MQTTQPETPSNDALLMRFLLQDAASRLLPGERVSVCLRWRAPMRFSAGKMGKDYSTVDIFYNSGARRASYKNLIVCSRLWQCPVCAARITEQRRQELQSASETSDFGVAMVTLTMRHNIKDNLASMVAAIVASYRALKAGRFWQETKSEYWIAGDVRALEVTYGDNGWHCHIHALLFFDVRHDDISLGSLEMTLKRRFLAILAQHGYDATWEHGLKVSGENRYIREYVAKFGRLPVVEKTSLWTIYHEVTKSPAKKTRADGGLTPWGLLLAYTLGDKQAGKLFVEYAKVFKGYHQLQWSRGLKALLKIESVSDAEAGRDNDANYLMSIDSETWDEIARLGKRGELLRAVEHETGDPQAIRNYIAQIVDE